MRALCSVTCPLCDLALKMTKIKKNRKPLTWTSIIFFFKNRKHIRLFVLKNIDFMTLSDRRAKVTFGVASVMNGA